MNQHPNIDKLAAFIGNNPEIERLVSGFIRETLPAEAKKIHPKTGKHPTK